MKKLTIKKSRLVELNRGRLEPRVGDIETILWCTATQSMNIVCKGTSLKTCPLGQVAAQAG